MAWKLRGKSISQRKADQGIEYCWEVRYEGDRACLLDSAVRRSLVTLLNREDRS